MTTVYDQWLTSEPDWRESEHSRRCVHCGGFLAEGADKVEIKNEVIKCSGIATEHHTPYEEGVIAICGEGLRGKLYAYYTAECGEDCKPEGHSPHSEVINSSTTHYQTCRKCGEENVEVDW